MAIRNQTADQMLKDIKDAIENGRDLEIIDEHGATAVRNIIHSCIIPYIILENNDTKSDICF